MLKKIRFPLMTFPETFLLCKGRHVGISSEFNFLTPSLLVTQEQISEHEHFLASSPGKPSIYY